MCSETRRESRRSPPVECGSLAAKRRGGRIAPVCETKESMTLEQRPTACSPLSSRFTSGRSSKPNSLASALSRATGRERGRTARERPRRVAERPTSERATPGAFCWCQQSDSSGLLPAATCKLIHHIAMYVSHIATESTDGARICRFTHRPFILPCGLQPRRPAGSTTE